MAFSNSSSNNTPYFFSLILDDKIPGLEESPINFLTASSALYSDISSLIKAFSSLNKNSAKALAVSVFPTPVGPKNKNEPIGLFLEAIPDLALLKAIDISLTASSWFIIFL